MKNSVLCYIEKDEKYLMLYRNKKNNDCNGGKWIGVGGKIEENESPDEALVREVKEETGLTLTRSAFRGIVTFVSDTWEGEYMYVYTADGFEGEICDCDEGELHWVEKDKLFSLPMWEGDRVFLTPLLNDSAEVFRFKLVYSGDALIEVQKA
jgi:8-oxo-dGTP diphosphatase